MAAVAARLFELKAYRFAAVGLAPESVNC